MRRIAALGMILWTLSMATPLRAADTSSGVIRFNRPFRFGNFNVRIIKIEWMRATGYLVPLGQPDPSGTGALVLTVVLKNDGTASDHLPAPDIAVVFSDGSHTSIGARFPFDATGKRLSLDVYEPADGPTVRYIVSSVPQPTNANPISEIVFSPRYTGDAGPGVLRLIHPPVTIAQ
ncbi:MAG: hypothetical protein ABR584_04140 [Candidatus Baltobacteraceae bacterium]